MTHEIDRDDFEDVLQQFRPAGPPDALRTRALAAPIVDLGRKRWTIVGGVGLAAVLAIAVAMWVPRGNDDVVRSVAGGRPAIARTPTASAGDRVSFGIASDGAAVLVVEVTDWLCPGCEHVHQTMRSLEADYAVRAPGRVKFAVSDWPWESDCNTAVSDTLHPGACAAAAAVRLSRRVGNSTEMEDWLFANRSRILTLDAKTASTEIRAGAAGVLGVRDFHQQFDSALTNLQIELALRGFKPEVTPAVFVNGIELPSGSGATRVTQTIDAELNAASSFTNRPRGRANGSEVFGRGRRGGQ